MKSKLELILLYDVLRATPYLTVYTFLTQEPLVKRDSLIFYPNDFHNQYKSTKRRMNRANLLATPSGISFNSGTVMVRICY